MVKGVMDLHGEFCHNYSFLSSLISILWLDIKLELGLQNATGPSFLPVLIKKMSRMELLSEPFLKIHFDVPFWRLTSIPAKFLSKMGLEIIEIKLLASKQMPQ